MSKNFVEYTNADLAKTQIEKESPKKEAGLRF
jgi:hypothetical protein